MWMKVLSPEATLVYAIQGSLEIGIGQVVKIMLISKLELKLETD